MPARGVFRTCTFVRTTVMEGLVSVLERRPEGAEGLTSTSFKDYYLIQSSNSVSAGERDVSYVRLCGQVDHVAPIGYGLEPHRSSGSSRATAGSHVWGAAMSAESAAYSLSR